LRRFLLVLRHQPLGSISGALAGRPHPKMRAVDRNFSSIIAAQLRGFSHGRVSLTNSASPFATLCCHLDQNQPLGGVSNTQTSGTLKTNSGQFTPIPGLKLTLPELPEGVNILALALERGPWQHRHYRQPGDTERNHLTA
jgi:hypothetical protein